MKVKKQKRHRRAVRFYTACFGFREPFKVLCDELRSLGKSYTDSYNAAQILSTARCDHEQRKSAVNCLTEVIGEKNDEHFYVATQDAELRRKFHEIPGVPLIYALRNSLFMEKPSTMQHHIAATAEGESISSDANAISEDDRVNSIAKRRGLEVKDTVQFKKKKAKGPNPLSCLPKKMHAKKDNASEKGSSSADKTSGTRSKKGRGRGKRNV
ncbi:hypothetical protein Leryth_020172 [Lithospermum erythrorhizon]|nr:hypothetical protein Leryth_020172 [Lithospermum erythrorhizon]